MKLFATALLLLSSSLSVDAAKNGHGLNADFLKAMNKGAEKSEFLRKVSNQERKVFWKNLLKKAVPASEAGSLRATKASAGAAPQAETAEQFAERKLANNNNGNYNSYSGNGYYNNGNGNSYNYGNNQNVQYNYNGGQYQRQYENYDGEEAAQDDDQKYQGIDWSDLGFDMRKYSLKYTGCSAVKTFDNSKAQDEDSDTVLSTKRFALFRLCPSNNCNKYSVNGCGRNYGEYVLEMDSFLEGVVEFNRQRYWHYCHFCRRCNALESYGYTMSKLNDEQIEYYEEMQEQAEEYYEQQQQQYEAENEQYQNENAANYQYYNYNQNQDEDGERKLEEEDNQQQYYNAYNANNQFSNYYDEDGNAYNGNNNGNNGNNGNTWRQYYQKQYQNQQQYNYNKDQAYAEGNYNYQNQYNQQQNQEGQDEANQYQNMYNPYYWNEELYGEWNQDWSEAWLAFNWQVLPYCSEDELDTCQDASDMCSNYDDDFEEDADAMAGFSACTSLDNGYYIGPHCNSDGYTITLGVYSDEYCDQYVGDQVSLYDVLGYNIEDDFDFFPQECVSCEEGGEEREFAAFIEANQDFDTYEEWLDEKWQEYIAMAEQMYQDNNGEAQSQYQNNQAQYYQNSNYQANNQQGYYYQNGQQKQNGGGSYYYGDQDQQNQYAQYGGQYYTNQQMAENYGNYGAQMLNQGMNFYYNRGMSGSWITSEYYDKNQYESYQAAEDADYYYWKQGQISFAQSGIADVCGALYTYAAKCNTHLNMDSSSNAESSYGSSQQQDNEELVCNFIDNLQSQKYDEHGEVITDGSVKRSVSNFIDFATLDWTDADQVRATAQRSGVTTGQAFGLAITMAACLAMGVWACCLHSTLARKNIPWRPKRSKLIEPTDINRQSSGIVMGRSRSGMSTTSKNVPLIN